MKTCYECKHFEYGSWCGHVSARRGRWEMDYVHTGKKVWVHETEYYVTSTETAFDMRQGACGPEGRLWEPKPPRAWWKRLLSI